MGQNKRRYSKKIHIWNRVRFSLRGKKIIRNKTLVSKLLYICQIYTIPKYQKVNWKKNIQFPLEQEKIQPPNSNPRHLAQLFILRGRLVVLGKHTIKLYKNKMDSKPFKFHQCSLERSPAVLTEINCEFRSRPSHF